MKQNSSLETILRIRGKHGAVLAEYTIRGNTVEIVNYWPSGMIQDHGHMSLDQFLEEVQTMRAKHG